MEKFVDLCEQGPADSEERARIVVELLERGELHPGTRDNNGWYPIHYAAKHGCPDIVSLLLPHPHLETRGIRSTPLHIACTYERLNVVEALLPFCQYGAPPKVDRDKNTPLHLACRAGSLEITSRLLNKYPANAIYQANRNNATPLGVAVHVNNASLARLLLQRSLGNPAQKFSDFRLTFPSFKHKQSLDHPVTIFVMGKRQTGKSTIIKSLRVEGYFKRALGVIRSTSGVQSHSGGMVSSDASTYRYGRAKFCELASGLQTTQENVFLSTADPAHSLFLIILSFKDERREMESNMLYWLSFIYHQCKSRIGIKLNVAVIGSFLYYYPITKIRLDNINRLHLVYHSALSSQSHSELCSHFHFLGKYSMDCRRSESPGMRQLRNTLGRKCKEIRPTGGEQSIPSPCYVLLSALQGLRPEDSNVPVLQLSSIAQQISDSVSPSRPLSLFSLLPQNVEDLKPFLEILEERKAIVVIKHINRRDPWIIFDEFKLISIIDSIIGKKVTHTTQLHPAILPIEQIIEYLSPLGLKKEVLLNVLHYFKIPEVISYENTTRYFIPSVLELSQSHKAPSWNLDDTNYSFGFAWCIQPQSNQITPFFMPRFLYFMLYELFASTEGGDFDTVDLLDSGIHLNIASQLEVFVAINPSTICLNMRCAVNHVVPCLQYRNNFLSVIEQQRQLYQQNVKVNEFIVPMEGIIFPVQNPRRIEKCGTNINYIRNVLIRAPSATIPDGLQKILSFEPYMWLSKLSEPHQRDLLDPTLTNVSVSKTFLQDVAKNTGEKWSIIAEAAELLQTDLDSPHISSEDADQDESNMEENPQQPFYGQFLDFFSKMSIFHSTSELLSILKVGIYTTDNYYILKQSSIYTMTNIICIAFYSVLGS